MTPAEREVRFALNAVALPSSARAGRHRWRLVAPVRHRGFFITAPVVRGTPYGRSTSGHGYLTHVVAGVLLVWRRGLVVGQQARWRCGASSYAFRLMDEPDSVVCPVCTLQRPVRPE